jgi:hypothetical protein
LEWRSSGHPPFSRCQCPRLVQVHLEHPDHEAIVSGEPQTLPRLAQGILVVLEHLGHEADVSAEHLTSSKWQSPQRPNHEAFVGGDQHTPLPRLALVHPERPVHEAKSMEWITTCWWPQHGTTEPAASATENEESPVLDGATEPATSATENEESPDLDSDVDAPGHRSPRAGSRCPSTRRLVQVTLEPPDHEANVRAEDSTICQEVLEHPGHEANVGAEHLFHRSGRVHGVRSTGRLKPATSATENEESPVLEEQC